MRRGALACLAVAALAAGCGGEGGSATKFEDVKPCLDRLAQVVANEFTGTITTPTGRVTTLAPPPDTDVVDWSVDLAYGNPPRGANAAHLAFYKSDAAASREAKRAHAAATDPSTAGTLNANFRRMQAKAKVLGGSTIVTWSSPPTKQQESRLRACFNK